MAKKSIIIKSLFLISIFYFLISIFLPISIRSIDAVIIENGQIVPENPPPPPPPPVPNPNPTSAPSGKQNCKCWNAQGVMTGDFCVDCGSSCGQPPPGGWCEYQGGCGECGGGGGICTGGCVQSHQECSDVECDPNDCAQSDLTGCTWRGSKCMGEECRTICDLWLPAGTCATACVNGQCRDSCGNTLPCGSPPQATMTCPSSPVIVGDTVTFILRATDADTNF